MLKKPAKYSIKIFAMVDAQIFYTSNLEVYIGCHPKGPYKVSAGNIVKRLTKPLYKSGRNLTTDNWEAPVMALRKIYIKKITIVGTMLKKIRDKYLLNLKCVKEGKHIHRYSARCHINFLCDKKRKGAVDVAEEVAANYSTAHKTNR
ncbi:hypothetical protein AVEN_268217-1 [Araneus ventricosus]|uniref:PiggyBac transposable element-derived protein domain-containing protein n=1 Tax=Araneus ventricosus TaxID=182803 RepID=A0A4Y2PS53_ARAVE|nr:hypothetical protein AVEN_266574-1 [Araneus ventricosus]GBN53380.1 hypothetical protein AVEN_268217-1 [Araneus ventricosus]